MTNHFDIKQSRADAERNAAYIACSLFVAIAMVVFAALPFVPDRDVEQAAIQWEMRDGE